MAQDDDVAQPKDGEDYGLMLRLEELESLLEEAEEAEEGGPPGELPADLRDRMQEMGVTTTAAIRHEISRINRLLDEEG